MAASAVGLIVALGLMLPAGAQSAQPPTIGIDKLEVGLDGTVTVTVRNFHAQTSIRFQFFSTPVELGSRTTDDAGTASITFTIPEGTEPGVHHVRATGLDLANKTAVVEVEILVHGAGTAAQVSGAGLARTGRSFEPLVRVGSVLLAGGVLALAISKQRRRRAL